MWVDVRSRECDEDGCVIMRAFVPARVIEAEIGECLDFLGARGGLGPGADRGKLAARYGSGRLDALIARWVMERHGHPAVESLKASLACDPEYRALSAYEYGDDLEFQLKAYLLPKGALTSVEPVVVAPSAADVAEEAVDEQVRKLAERDALRISADPSRPVRMGDVVQLDTRVEREGAPIAAYSRDGAYLRMEPGSMPPSFIEAVEGMLPGEIREFAFEAPDPLGGGMVPYEARVHVGRVVELRPPALDDAWARRAWPGAVDMASLRRLIAELLARRGSAALDGAVDAAIAERLEVELPDALAEFAAGKMEADLRERLAGDGMTVAQHCAACDIDEEGLRAGLRLRAVESLRRAIALDALFEQRGMTVSESDLDGAISALTHAEPHEAKRDYILSGRMHLVEEAVRRSKAHQWLVDTAIVA